MLSSHLTEGSVWYKQSVMLSLSGLLLNLGAIWRLCLAFNTWAPTTHHSTEPLLVPFAEAFLDRTGQSSAFRVPFSASVLVSRARIIEEMDQQTPQPNVAVAACSMARLALLSRDKTTEDLKLRTSL